jgi:protein-disulfide isomerase/uncharacterized membrane protein
MARQKNNNGSRWITPSWRVAFLVLCTIGICLAADLQRLHVNVHTDPDYQSYCAMSERVNCETVAASGYAVYAGLPLAVWGLAAYGFLFALSVWGLRRRLPVQSWPYGALFWISLVAAAVGVALWGLSHYVIESVCLVCAGTYFINVALLFVATMELRRIGRSPLRALQDEMGALTRGAGGAIGLVALTAVALLVTWAVMEPYWKVQLRSGPDGLTVGHTAEGHPWIGATRPVVEIIEYSDYECPHCRRGHAEMRTLVKERPDQVRLVHRHYPLDHTCNPSVSQPFHLRACAYARMAHCAGEQERFWEANDYLYAHGRERDEITADRLAGELGLDASDLETCLAGVAVQQAVGGDIAAGRAMRVRGTPAFVLDGEVYPGRIPPDVLEAALAGESPAAP